MNKTMLVFCDIVGTYGKRESSVERKNDVSHFICLLENIRRLNNCDKIVFSFISSDSCDDVRDALDEIRMYDICNNLSYGKSFYVNGYLEIKNNSIIKQDSNTCLNKAATIISYAKSLSEECDIDKIFYFDDTEHYHMFFRDLSSLYNCNFDMVSIIPTSLRNLNDRLESHIHVNYGNKKMIKSIKEAVFN